MTGASDSVWESSTAYEQLRGRHAQAPRELPRGGVRRNSRQREDCGGDIVAQSDCLSLAASPSGRKDSVVFAGVMAVVKVGRCVSALEALCSFVLTPLPAGLEIFFSNQTSTTHDDLFAL